MLRLLLSHAPNPALVKLSPDMAARHEGKEIDFDQLVAKIVGFVEAPSLGLDLPLDVRGTAFQQRVWQALRKIPAGRRVSYREIAKRIGAPTSVRAVARACGANTASACWRSRSSVITTG